MWGTVDGESFAHALRAARAECVHWKRNVFNVPSGSVGKSFVCEMVRLLTAFNDRSPWKSIALKRTLYPSSLNATEARTGI